MGLKNSCKTSGARFHGRRAFAFLALVVVLLPGDLMAVRYFTVAEVQKVCFPEATRFENKVARFSRPKMSAIGQASGVQVKIPGIRYSIALKGEKILGVVAYDYVLGKSQVIDYAIAITPEGAVKQIEVMVYRESHGHEIRRPGWRKQFPGKTTNAKLRLNDDISNISGATISCRNVTAGVKRVLHTWRLELRPALVAAGRLPVGSD